MERPICPARLEVLPGGRDAVPVSEDDRERRVLERVAEGLRHAVSELPAVSSWRLPLVRFRRAVVRWLRRPR
jgi:hypothetical protein